VKLIWCYIIYILCNTTLAQWIPYLVQFPGSLVTATDSRQTTAIQTNKQRERERERKREREREKATFESESLMSFLTRFGDEGKSSIRKIVSLFFFPSLRQWLHCHTLIC